MNVRLLWLTCIVILTTELAVSQYLYAQDDATETTEQETADADASGEDTEEGAVDAKEDAPEKQDALEESVATKEATEEVASAEEKKEQAVQPAPAAETKEVVPDKAKVAEKTAEQQKEEKPDQEAQQEKQAETKPEVKSDQKPEEKTPAQIAPQEGKSKANAAEKQKKQPEEELPGIDTLGLEEPGGNWLFKRIWWERAEREFEKIRATVEQLFEERMVFLKQRSEIDRTLFDPFYREVGLERGELREIVLYLIERTGKLREEQGGLNDEERDFLNTLLKEQKTLEQLQADIDEIDKLDKAIDESILLLAEQINRARNYENSAWQEFKAIGKELNDKRARERYYSMKAIFESIQDIDAYIKGSFSQHFQALVTAAHEHVDRVKAAVKTLRDRQIDLKLEAEKLENVAKQVKGEEPEEIAPGFFGSIMHSIGNFFAGLWHFLFGWLSSSKA